MDKEAYLSSLRIDTQEYHYYDLKHFASDYDIELSTLPYSLRILLENLLSSYDDDIVTFDDLMQLGRWEPDQSKTRQIAFYPSRVVMQDFTGVPCLVDLAALRDAMAAHGAKPSAINPVVPIDLIVDHSVQVDHYASKDALGFNLDMEYKRNKERYAFLKWAQHAFENLRVFPPGAGIVHQVNLEHIATVVGIKEQEEKQYLHPDTLIGTDSHTTMINGLGVLGWGVGGIEAEAVALGEPYSMKVPKVIGVRLTGSLPSAVTATDLVLRVTEMLRQEDTVDAFVEFFGEGMGQLSLADRATIANMAPEYGATMGFFPVDEETLRYLSGTGRSEEAKRAEAYLHAQQLFYDPKKEATYSRIVTLDLGSIEASVAGPSRPQDRMALREVPKRFSDILGCDYGREIDEKSLATLEDETATQADTSVSEMCRMGVAKKCAPVEIKGDSYMLCDGSVVIAAITSCTNTSNPSVMLAAGLLARNAHQKGLHVPAYVKTSLAPGSKVVEAYLREAGLLKSLEALGFGIVGYGCTTCIGNSGPLDREIEAAIEKEGLIVSAVLSGNRNFEARIHPKVKSNFLASPPLVLAYALAGRIWIDFEREALGEDREGNPVYLRDIWPKKEEIDALIASLLTPALFKRKYADILEGEKRWRELACPEGERFAWDADSTYLRKPPYFDHFKREYAGVSDIVDARTLLLLGDSVTTDHISPAGRIPAAYPAGKYLLAHGVPEASFNSYGSRRGNHEVMIRGTFANERIKNVLVAPKEGGYTRHFPEGREMFVYDAAMAYAKEGVALIVLAGDDYGMGSSRDWAAKGTQLLGIKAVIAHSYERIHRNNLVGMGVLPLAFHPEESWQSLGLDGTERFTIHGIEQIQAGGSVTVKAVNDKGESRSFEAVVRLDTAVDLRYFRNGGILPYVLRQKLS